MTSVHRIIATAIVVIQLGVMRIVVSAQQNSDRNENGDWCLDSRFDDLNATSSYSVPGFAPPGNTSSPSDSVWTFSTGAVNYNGKTTRRLWINTSPAIQVDSDSLSYQGCVIELLSLIKEAPAGKEQDKDGDCTSVLGEKCVATLLQNAKDVGRNLSADMDQDSKSYKLRQPPEPLSFSSAQCQDFVLKGFLGECGHDGRFDFYQSPYIGHHPKLYQNDTLALENGFGDASQCPNTGTNGTAATSPLFEVYTTPANATSNPAISDYNTYDQWLNHVVPVLIPVWSKDPKQAWSDSRLICMRPEAVKQEQKSGNGSAIASGSLSPTLTQQSSSSTQTGSAAQPSASVQAGFAVRGIDGFSRGSTVASIFIIAFFMMMMM